MLMTSIKFLPNLESSLTITISFLFKSFKTLPNFRSFERLLPLTTSSIHSSICILLFARGRKGGRPKGLSSEARIKAIAVYQLYQSKRFIVSEILKQTGISLGTLYSYVRLIEQEETKAKEKSTINTNA